jgi:hypothetical protein
VSTDSGPLPPGLAEPPAWPPPTRRAPTASACEPYRELIELALGRGRNAMAIGQDLVEQRYLNVSERQKIDALTPRAVPAANRTV